jgi:hypothetical protein
MMAPPPTAGAEVVAETMGQFTGVDAVLLLTVSNLRELLAGARVMSANCPMNGKS